MFDNLDKTELSQLESSLEQNKKNALSLVQYDDYPEEYDESNIIDFAERKASEAADNLIDEVKSTFDDVLKGFVKPSEESDPFEKMRELLTDDSNFFEQVENWKKFMDLAADTIEDIRKYFFEDHSTTCEETVDHLRSIERDLGDRKTGRRLGNWEKVKEEA